MQSKLMKSAPMFQNTSFLSSCRDTMPRTFSLGLSMESAGIGPSRLLFNYVLFPLSACNSATKTSLQELRCLKREK